MTESEQIHGGATAIEGCPAGAVANGRDDLATRLAATFADPASMSRLRTTSPCFVDLLDELPDSTGLTQDLMLSKQVPVVYERWWRPAWGRIAMGPRGPSMADEYRAAQRLLHLEPGKAVLDVACGTGNFTRRFGRSVEGDGGFVVGVDVSPTMLGRALADTRRTGQRDVAYVRCDASRLPFRDGAFDAVCCFAALQLFDDPWTAMREMVRVLRPGGRIALLTTGRAVGTVTRVVEYLYGRLGDMRTFERDEITGTLADAGCVDVLQRFAGVAQLVAAGKPAQA